MGTENIVSEYPEFAGKIVAITGAGAVCFWTNPGVGVPVGQLLDLVANQYYFVTIKLGASPFTTNLFNKKGSVLYSDKVSVTYNINPPGGGGGS